MVSAKFSIYFYRTNITIFAHFFYILQQKIRKNKNIFLIKFDRKFFGHHFYCKDVFYQIKIYLDPYLQGIIDSGPICTFTFSAMVGFSGGPPLTCDHLFGKIRIQILYISTGFHLVF